MVLRRATPQDRYSKAASVGTFNPQFDIDYVWHKFPYARQPDSGDWLINRLGKANARRREFLKYCKEHHEKLAFLPVTSSGREGKQPSETSGTPQDIPAGQINFSVRTVVSSERSASIPAPTTATTYIEPSEEPMQINDSDTVSMTSYATSIKGQVEGRLTFPLRPKESANGRPFECPYCYNIEVVKSDNAWRYSALLFIITRPLN